MIEQVGEGTYGEVYKAKDKKSHEIVALKKIRMSKTEHDEGFPITAIREIKILKRLKHKNIVNLKEIVTSSSTKTDKGRADVFLVFEYLEHDLSGLLDTERSRISKTHIECYMKQLLTGVSFMHKNNILHRDIKCPNLLLNNDGELKIGDWGLARPIKVDAKFTNKVITLWYRPPELLLGAVEYGPSADMWSVGCIFAELLIGEAIFPGNDELDQLKRIFRLCGTPTRDTWPGYEKLPNNVRFEFNESQPSCLRKKFLNKNVSSEELELVQKLLALDPKKRISASDALDSAYFWSNPPTWEPHQLPKFKTKSVHEYQARQKRQRDREHQQADKRSRHHHYQGQGRRQTQSQNTRTVQ